MIYYSDDTGTKSKAFRVVIWALENYPVLQEILARSPVGINAQFTKFKLHSRALAVDIVRDVKQSAGDGEVKDMLSILGMQRAGRSTSTNDGNYSARQPG